MTKKILTAASLIVLGSLSACGSTGLFDRERPDEFAVTRAKQLEVPADFTLPTPEPKGTAPAADTKQQVLDALFGNAKTPGA